MLKAMTINEDCVCVMLIPRLKLFVERLLGHSHVGISTFRQESISVGLTLTHVNRTVMYKGAFYQGWLKRCQKCGWTSLQVLGLIYFFFYIIQFQHLSFCLFEFLHFSAVFVLTGPIGKKLFWN